MDETSLKITELINKSEVTGVVHSYFRALDEKNFAARYFASIFTAEATVTRPNGASLIGPTEISASHEKSFARFEGSQHLLTGHDISIHGNRATVRANLVAMQGVRPARTTQKTALSQAVSYIPNLCRQTGNGRFRRSAMMLSGVPADLETWRRPNKANGAWTSNPPFGRYPRNRDQTHMRFLDRTGRC